MLEARDKARHYFLTEILNDHPLSSELIDDIINLTESGFPRLKKSGEVEINEKTVSLVYAKIYKPIPDGVIPTHMLKGNDPNSAYAPTETILSTPESNQPSHLKIVK